LQIKELKRKFEGRLLGVYLNPALQHRLARLYILLSVCYFWLFRVLYYTSVLRPRGFLAGLLEEVEKGELYPFLKNMELSLVDVVLG
jgi:hypothetical protein